MSSDATPSSTSGDSYSDELRPGETLLRGQYTIEKFLNCGGFGMTYIARDSLDRPVVIKECFPAALCTRSATRVHARSRTHSNEFKSIVRSFLKEAQRLSTLSHPNIVGVHQVFEDNDTAYMALDFIDGLDLLDVIEDKREPIPPAEMRHLLIKVLEAVKHMHECNILHRDISPDNILIDRAGEPILIDFGAAREAATQKSRILSELLVVKDGYSPQEFYLAGSDQGPSSDLYALAATFYHLISGTAPPSSQIRLAEIAAQRDDPYVSVATVTSAFDEGFLTAIDKALSIFPKDRVQSAQDWLVEVDVEKRRKEALERAEKDRNIDLSISKLISESHAPDAPNIDEIAAPRSAALPRSNPKRRASVSPNNTDLMRDPSQRPAQTLTSNNARVSETVAASETSAMPRPFFSRWRHNSTSGNPVSLAAIWKLRKTPIRIFKKDGL